VIRWSGCPFEIGERFKRKSDETMWIVGARQGPDYAAELHQCHWWAGSAPGWYPNGRQTGWVPTKQLFDEYEKVDVTGNTWEAL
jgi:hypothetical protein